jgi:hypothetical protein
LEIENTAASARIVRFVRRLVQATMTRTVDRSRRWSWIVDGTLIPTRDHQRAAKSKNYR